MSTRAQNKVLEYYQEILWGEVGNFLEHIILWWGSSSLASKPPKCSQNLREWITRFVPTGKGNATNLKLPKCTRLRNFLFGIMKSEFCFIITCTVFKKKN